MSPDEPAGPGTLVLVVGPSGAGKDALITRAASELSADDRFVFPNRMVTRAPGAAEEHDVIDWDAYHKGVQDDRFALSWEAHGLGYALPVGIDEHIRRGATIVVNVSRRVVSIARSRYRHVIVVLVTAPLDVRRERILARGRELLSEIDSRLGRSADDFSPDMADFTIDNSGPIEIGSAKLLAALREIGTRSAGST